MDKIWLNKYPKNVASEIDLDPQHSLLNVVQDSVAKFGDKEAFMNMGKSISYNELNREAEAFAAYLQNELGIKKGDAVAIMMPNLLQYPVALIAVHRIGAIVVNVNPLYTR